MRNSGKKKTKAARPKKAAAAKKGVRTRKNMPAAEREKVILESAIRFFAEHGFEGQQRELAKRIGITHSAIYRHFPSKEALVERVYEHVYLGSWQKHWGDLIQDRTRPLEARLIQFYSEYIDHIFRFDWVRIFIFAGLKSFNINEHYLSMVMKTVGTPALLEAREEFGFTSPDTPIGWREQELFWGLHGRIFYMAIRKFVYRMPVPPEDERGAVVSDAVHQFIVGTRRVLSELQNT
ncbi:AcrR family transcriptional regulator [Nitrobacteraceae bacterium AZCC 1564]